MCGQKEMKCLLAKRDKGNLTKKYFSHLISYLYSFVFSSKQPTWILIHMTCNAQKLFL